MAKVVIDVPDGEYCGECGFLKNIVLCENDLYADNIVYRTKRHLSGICVLFNKEIHGYHVEKLSKCKECRRWD